MKFSLSQLVCVNLIIMVLVLAITTRLVTLTSLGQFYQETTMLRMTRCCMLRANFGCNNTMSWGELLGKVHVFYFSMTLSKYQSNSNMLHRF